MKRAKSRSNFLIAAILFAAAAAARCIRARRNRAAASISARVAQRIGALHITGTPEGLRNRSPGREAHAGNARSRRAQAI